MNDSGTEWFSFLAAAGQACTDLANELRRTQPDASVRHGSVGRVLRAADAGSPTYSWEFYVEIVGHDVDTWWWFELSHGEAGWCGEASLNRGRGDDQVELEIHEWATASAELAFEDAGRALTVWRAFRPAGD